LTVRRRTVSPSHPFTVEPRPPLSPAEEADAIYRGREDFVYRIAVGELPFVTSIFPLGGTTGAQTTIEANGWNLPASSLTPQAKDKGAVKN
jgi:hypothetical protein